MLKFSNFISISCFFIFVFIIFIAINPASHPINVVENIDYAISRSDSEPDAGYGRAPYIAVVSKGVSDTERAENISLVLSLMKCDYEVYGSVREAAAADTIIVATADLTSNDVNLLRLYLSSGGNVVFSVLPGIMTREVMSLLEITSYAPDCTAEGFDIYDEVLLGSMFRAEELRLDCARVKVSGRCKIFALGYDPDRDRDASALAQNYRIPLIWRTYLDGGAIFVINAPFFEDVYCAGILAGVLSCVIEDFIYPVVGVKSILLNNYPYLTAGNVTINNRTPYVFARDVIWPDLYSAGKRLDITYTAFAGGSISNSPEAGSTFSYFPNELYKEGRGEMGYSQPASSTLASASNGLAIINHYSPYQIVTSIRTPPHTDTPVDNITSIVSGTWDRAFEWVTDVAVKLPVISSGFISMPSENNTSASRPVSGLGSERANFEFTSMLTALGLVIHEYELDPIFDNIIPWDHYFREMSSQLTYLADKSFFLKSSSLRDAAEYVKNYLNYNMEVTRSQDRLDISLKNSASGRMTYFYLRTKKTIVEGVDCVITKIQETQLGRDYYMIQSSSPDFSIVFADKAE